DGHVTGVQTCALPICALPSERNAATSTGYTISGRSGRRRSAARRLRCATTSLAAGVSLQPSARYSLRREPTTNGACSPSEATVRSEERRVGKGRRFEG